PCWCRSNQEARGLDPQSGPEVRPIANHVLGSTNALIPPRRACILLGAAGLGKTFDDTLTGALLGAAPAVDVLDFRATGITGGCAMRLLGLAVCGLVSLWGIGCGRPTIGVPGDRGVMHPNDGVGSIWFQSSKGWQRLESGNEMAGIVDE